MSLRPAARASVRSAVGDLFYARFVRDAHELIAEGYSRLDASALGEEEEEVISGLIASTVLTLLIVPTVYAMLDRLQGGLAGRAGSEDDDFEAVAGAEPEAAAG